MTGYAGERFGTVPEYLWARTPECAVLRRRDNSKWYALIMNIPRKYIGLEGDEITDILNVKCDQLMLGSLLQTEGFFPAYHMNKNSWISILLDGTVPERTIFRLIDMSYELAGGKKTRKGNAENK